MPVSRSLLANITSSLDWWREAGVEHVFSEAPHGWLAAPEAPDRSESRGRPAPPPAREPEPSSAPAAARIGGVSASWPQTLSGFAEWWLSEPSIDGGPVRGRVAPRGSAGAALMVLVATPEQTDAELLLSGPQGRLLDAMLAAMGTGRDATYLASVLPRHVALPDWSELSASGIGALIAHHVALVAPQRVIAFGASILPLLGHDPAQKTAFLPSVNQQAPDVPLLVAHELGHLARRPGAKAAFWRNWLEWD